MSRSTAAIAELATRLPPGATVIAVTDDGVDPRYAPVRALAASIAAAAGGNVLFCVAPARDTSPPRARPRLFFPPVDGGARPHTGTRRRDLLLGEARAVLAPGLAVGVWLPSHSGPAAVAEAAAATAAALVVVPARAHRPGVLDRTLEYLAARVPTPIVALRPDGTLEPVHALGERADAAWPRVLPACARLTFQSA